MIQQPDETVLDRADRSLPVRHRLQAHQAVAVAKIIAEPSKAALLASDMGKGKTTIAVETMLQLGLERVLVVGVKDTFAQWDDRFSAQSGGTVSLLRLDGTRNGRENFADMVSGKKGFYFIGNQYLVRRDWVHLPISDGGVGSAAVQAANVAGSAKLSKERHHLQTYKSMVALDGLIFDEAHTAANRKSVGRKSIASIPTEWKLAMSGTWVGNKFENAWSISRWLWPEVVDPSFYRWASEWCESAADAARDGRPRAAGEKHPGRYVSTLPCYIRSEADEQPPAPRVILVDLLPRQRVDYEALESNMVVWLQAHEGAAAMIAELPITLRARLRTATLGVMSLDQREEVYFRPDTPSTKLDALQEVLREYGQQTVAVFTDSKRFAKVVVSRLREGGHAAVEWSGDVPSPQRDRIKQEFLDGKITCLVAVISAFSTGLDGFQRVCSKVVWLSESENTMLNNQALARFFRPGRTGSFEHTKILARNTHDVGIYSSQILETLRMNRTLRQS